MPRWKALPEELDPQIREFASQLRRLVDRSGLNINAVADRTGYSKTSWERYLNGRLLPPRRAVVALAEVTDTPQHHLTTMWELAERAWSRAEMRHDMTMEAIRITQARAALGELGTTGPADAKSPAAGGKAGPGRSAGGRHSAAGSAARVPTATGPDGYGPGPGVQEPAGYGSDPYGSDSYGAYGPGGHGDGRTPSVPAQRGSAPHAPYAQQPGGNTGEKAGKAGKAGKAPAARGRGKVAMLVGAAGALIVVVGAVLLAPGGDDPAKATPPPTVAPTTAAPELPVGVECNGEDCTGQNPEEMGCGGEYARTVSSTVVGASKVEVRYSEVCSAAWARLTEAAIGDTVTITAGAAADGQDGEVMGDTDAYTPMVGVKKPGEAKACATLTSGTKGCTTP
ncbi:XRE family transcriptional regulator [Streptomyces griseus]|uniref:XRE family transcriptional regulator n=1 Tax=Streptomyces stephensoniae TaxID=3375367 RepID=A0ABU2VU99_9ACTN|nr:XRE family transcriptional regulator [Streptomyces griseus]MDT0489137.1 XRE family transcriptional regulator [Streptomyces griseus]